MKSATKPGIPVTLYGRTWRVVDGDSARIHLRVLRAFPRPTAETPAEVRALVEDWTWEQWVEAHQAAVTCLWPGFEWHDWSLDILGCWCQTGDRWLTVAGSASSAKSFTVATLALLAFYSAPADTLCLLTSTTIRELQQRVGGIAVDQHRDAQSRRPWLGNRAVEVAGENAIVPLDRDGKKMMRRGLRAIATMDSSGSWVGLRGVGFKAPRLLFVGDELSLMLGGFADSAANLSVNCQFRFVGCGNFVSRDDPLGMLSEPLDGWASLSESNEARAWRTRRGLCLQLPGLSTPNGDTDPPRYSYLVSRRYIENMRAMYGETDIRFRAFAAGALPSGASELTVLDRPLITRMQADQPAAFVGPVRQFAGLDLAYGGAGGDRCVLAFLTVGTDRHGHTIIADAGHAIIPVTQGGNLATTEENIAREARSACEQKSIPPERFGFDSSFGSFGSAVARIWSTRCHPTVFAGPPVDPDPAQGEVELTDQPAPPSQRFSKRASQITWRMREAVETGAFRSLDEQAADEFTRRRYTITSRSGERIKLDVEPKPPFRQRTGKSPDLADARCIALDAIAAAGVSLKPIRSDHDADPVNDPNAWAHAEAARVNAYERGLSRPDLDMPTYMGRVAEANHQLDQLDHPEPFRRVVTSTGTVEVRMPVHTGPPSGDDDVDDANLAHDVEVRRGTFRRIADLTR